VLGLLLEVELGEDLDEGRHFDGLLVVDTMAAKGAGDLAAAAETWILWWLRRGVGGGGRAEGAHEDVVMVGHCGEREVMVGRRRRCGGVRHREPPWCPGRSWTSGPGHNFRHFRFPGCSK
jgi:hypothetical protein